ncbi:Ataxin-7-like protein 3 [Coemansia aciculifera]|uniref:Ataxin-7-like protein 3 n=1 Tax=Coemansia aciculifera TaxID=417176 RepID=A0ACC1M4C9_9FUNG|nr:Ataxin-7-like protein 3 [Coemansia aciculifera]
MKAKVDVNGSSGAASSTSDKKKAATEVYDELLKFYENKIDALRQTRDALENTNIAGGSDGDDNSDSGSDDAGAPKWSRALLAMELFAEMIDDMMMDVVFETHLEAKQCESTCSVCNTRCQSDANVVQSDVVAADGSSPGMAAEMFECPNCQRPYPAARFASHMDNAVSTPSYPGPNYESSSEQSMDRKRKPAALSGGARDASAASSSRKKAKRK